MTSHISKKNINLINFSKIIQEHNQRFKQFVARSGPI